MVRVAAIVVTVNREVTNATGRKVQMKMPAIVRGAVTATMTLSNVDRVVDVTVAYKQVVRVTNRLRFLMEGSLGTQVRVVVLEKFK